LCDYFPQNMFFLSFFPRLDDQALSLVLLRKLLARSIALLKSAKIAGDTSAELSICEIRAALTPSRNNRAIIEPDKFASKRICFKVEPLWDETTIRSL
jgi:hypothetical protein